PTARPVTSEGYRHIALVQLRQRNRSRTEIRIGRWIVCYRGTARTDRGDFLVVEPDRVCQRRTLVEQSFLGKPLHRTQAVRLEVAAGVGVTLGAVRVPAGTEFVCEFDTSTDQLLVDIGEIQRRGPHLDPGTRWPFGDRVPGDGQLVSGCVTEQTGRLAAVGCDVGTLPHDAACHRTSEPRVF